MLSKIATVRMADMLPRLALTGPSAALVEFVPDVPTALDRLEADGYLAEAGKLIAHALPRRETVWWACMCARHTRPADLPEADEASLTAAEEWVRKQTDEIRRVAFAHAEKAGFGSPEAWAAVAAFWSGDSMAPLGQPVVPPAPHLGGTASAGSVALASVRTYPERRTQRMRMFLRSAREIASGGPGRLPPEEV